MKDIQEMQHYVITPGFLSYAGVIIVGCICVVFFVAPKYGKKSMLVYLTVCSLIGGLSVVATQGLGSVSIARTRSVREADRTICAFANIIRDILGRSRTDQREEPIHPVVPVCVTCVRHSHSSYRDHLPQCKSME